MDYEEDSREHPRKLEENMVIALETWTGKKGGKDGVCLEQCMVITKDGYKVNT